MKNILSTTALAIIAVCILSGCSAPTPATTVKLPILFSDHMVLQQNANIVVWGKATPHQQVTVRFKDQQAQNIASADSTWRVMLAPEPAGGPYTLEVIGAETQTISDVLVGEVWLASGQSNMEWSVRASANPDAEIAAANDSQIRLFTVKRTVAAAPQDNIPSDGWHITSPQTIENFSAVAYYFGRTLRDSLDVPIGLIHSSWGGTPAESWTSTLTLVDNPDFKDQVDELSANPDGFDSNLTFQQWLSEVSKQDAGFENESPIWVDENLDDNSWNKMQIPQLWEDAGLSGFDGIIWFRKSFTIPESWAGKELTISAGKVDDIDQTWVNGILVGSTSQFNEVRNYQIPASAVKAGTNTVVIQALDTGGGGGIWGEADQLFIQPTDNSGSPISLAGTWKYKTGLDLKSAKLPRPPGGQQHTPTVLYNAMIHPLIPYTIQGAIWYQGESNASRAYQYRGLFRELIQDWRALWDHNFGFYFVQLANFLAPQEHPVEYDPWPELREAQTMALSEPNTGMAVTIDIGEADDIHPRNKQDVGRRLALSALKVTYEHNITGSGPLYVSHEIEGSDVVIQFDHAGMGLHTPGNAPVKGFAVAGADSVWHWANVEMDSASVRVSSPSVPQPIAVRYGWANNPDVNLYNMDGLPASPFRTDDWPGVTVGNK